MTGASIDAVDHLLPASSDEAGTAPGDRRFRPDVEGLRAVAIVLVVLYHGGLNTLSGGYVGVDVFFVISGFVITGVLLRDQASSMRTSFLSFYGRRSRRIIPAATLVIVATIVGTYLVLGALYGNPTAVDARWTAVFLANFHFAAVGSNYLNDLQPPSPLLNFWSLAVEEQFYLAYPAFFLVIAGLGTKVSLHARLILGLTSVIVLSFGLSIAQTNSDPATAYFSPFTRAWELALGALVAVSTRWLLRIPEVVSTALSWIGLVAIGFSAVAFGANTVYPGSLVAVPVLGAGLVIAGGVHAPRFGAESMLGLGPFRWLGRLSYSLYLWHWPLLVIAAEAADKTSLPFSQNVFWLVLALAAAAGTYALIENPIRHARFFSQGWKPIALGVVLIGVALAVATLGLNEFSNIQAGPLPTAASFNQLEQALSVAQKVRVLPSNLTPSLAQAHDDWGGPTVSSCSPSLGQTSIPKQCIFGDPQGSHLVVMYGDSHAAMWFDAFNAIAKKAHWKFIDLGKDACAADSLPFYPNPPGWGSPSGDFTACKQWHLFAIHRIDQLNPDLLVISQQITGAYTPQQLQVGLADTLKKIKLSRNKEVILGNIPVLPRDPLDCLARHSSDIQLCSGSLVTHLTPYNRADQAEADAAGARYIDVTPWFCSSVCPAVIGRYEVYFDQSHVNETYTLVLEGVLRQALGLPA